LYNGGGDENNDGVRDGRIGNDCVERTDPALDSASDSYSKEEISVGDSKHSSCPTYTIY